MNIPSDEDLIEA